MSNYLAGKLLLATPTMGDPRFHRAVIFLCAHDEEGAMGLVINHKMPTVDFKDLAKQIDIQSDINIDFDMPVMCGGPVESARGFLLHSNDFVRPETMQIEQKYGITGTTEALKEIMVGKGPKDVLFILGYAGWDAGQLDEEILSGAWLVVEPDQELIFETSIDSKWTNAIQKIGIDPSMLSSATGRA